MTSTVFRLLDQSLSSIILIFFEMDLNEAMVELYKKRSTFKKSKDIVEEEQKKLEQNKDDDGQDRKRMKLDDMIAAMEYRPKATFDQLYGCDEARDKVLKCISRFQRSISGCAKKSEWPILIFGTRGLGKTSIVEAAANYANLKMVPISLKTLIEYAGKEFRGRLTMLVEHCKANQPALVLFDDIEQLNDKEESRCIVRNVIQKLKVQDNSLLIFCTTSSVLDHAWDKEFLFTINLKRPALDGRRKILKQLRERNKNLVKLSDSCLESLAIDTPSFTALDLRKMLDIAETESGSLPEISHCYRAIDVVKESFKRGTHLIGEKPSITWEDIGGLAEVRQEFVSILRQIKRGYSNCKFAGIALHGPPGCGKTMVAQAMANEGGFNFISIKPAELVDKFLGETEKNIRRVFSEAREHEPCMIYFDEFDGLCGTRGNKDTVTSAIQTLLNEMDGFANRGQSIILASTNRLDDIDAAIKRPGRLSKHIYVGPPDEKARRDILGVITKKPSIALASDVDLDNWARKTENFTGADLDFLVAEAEFRAISEFDSLTGNTCLDGEQTITLKREHFEYAISRIRSTNKELSNRMDR